MFSTAKTAAFGAIAAAGMAFAAPAAAAPVAQGLTTTAPIGVASVQPIGDMQFEHGRKHHKRWKRGRGHARGHSNRGYRQQRGYRDQRAYYGEPVYRNTRVWRDRRDGQYYCRKQNGTTGLLIGGAAGALVGREIAGNGDRTLGAILGAAGGALLGREIDRGGSRCR